MSVSKVVECLNEDTVNCLFFLCSIDCDNLEELCKSINERIHQLSAKYLWHRDEFRVHIPVNAEEKNLPPHLVSKTCFGDNIEDEWFIVYLVLEITSQHQNLIVQVNDNDGEFLLIEAADYLPSWANPETTGNRVFIYQGQIHFIPSTIANTDTDMKIRDALNMIIDPCKNTKSNEIQLAVLKRIGNYPEKIKENIHKAVVKLPLHIATLLHMKPSLISPIVSAYCNHDVIDIKTCRNAKYDDCVITQISFTKCLYAMLVHTKLIKSIKNLRVNENDKKTSLGLKLTCGYDIIMSTSSENPFTSKQFNTFHKSLIENGYFKENIKGSQNYNLLLENAKHFFLNMECPVNTQVTNMIKNLMNTKEFNDLKETVFNSSQDDLVENKDDWLNIHPEELNNLLNSKYGKQSKIKNDCVDSQTIAAQLSNFLKQTSDFEGIETSRDEEDPGDGNIQFNSEEFMDCVTKMMKFMTSNDEDLISNSSDEMYPGNTDTSIPEDELDKELKSKLLLDKMNESKDTHSILLNMIQSMKEEQGSSGPSSNILQTIGIKKTDILDSDDDEE